MTQPPSKIRLATGSYATDNKRSTTWPKLLLVTHNDGFAELFCDRKLEFHHAAMLPTSADSEAFAEKYLELSLPKPFRAVYWPGWRRATALIRPVSIDQEIDRRYGIALHKAISAIGRAVAPQREREVATWIL